VGSRHTCPASYEARDVSVKSCFGMETAATPQALSNAKSLPRPTPRQPGL
jgi:hypothetical protein